MRSRIAFVVVMIAILAATGAALMAQDPTTPESKIGVLRFYTIEREAPQFATARAQIGTLEREAASLATAAKAYIMLEPEEFDEALAIEKTPEAERTGDQAERLMFLRGVSRERKMELNEILQLRPSEGTPQSDARAGELQAINTRCHEHWIAKAVALEQELEAANSDLQERVTDDFETAVATVAAARGLEAVLQHSIRTTGTQPETGLSVVEFHRVVHYAAGPDVTDEVLAELNRMNAEELGLAPTG